MKKLIFRLSVLCLLIGLATPVFSQSVPVDAKIRYGKLDNGLTYYIRHNEKPKQRAEFFIAQNVGAILENDDQNGLAHFLEHMCFNGTKNFPGKGIINYFETIGVKFGANINAYTSLDETVYNLSDVPTNRETIVDSALLVLHDWSGFVSLLDSEIDAERGVILEEWRTGAGAERRMWKELNRLKYEGSQYAKRDVIGDTAVIKHFKYQTLRDYYQKWYRPDQQAILVVGDIDVDKVEAKIKALFADVPRKSNAGERPIYNIPDNEKPVVALTKDAEAKTTRIEVEYKHDKLPAEVKKSMQGYAVNIVNNIISMIVNYRFDEMTQQADAAFVGGGAMYGELVKPKDAFRFIVIPKEGQEAQGMNALLTEIERIKRFGFTTSEIERAKTDMLKSVENAYNDRDNQKNEDYVEEYIRNFLNDEVIPGIEWEFTTLKMILPTINADIVNQVVKSYITDNNMIISVSSPDKAAVKVPSQEEILANVESVKKAELKANAEENLNKPLIKKVPKAGKVKKITENTKFGATEWLLSNGVKVVFKPTEFKKDEIIMSAFSEGGFSKVKNPADLVSATVATSIIQNNGLGQFNQIELQKMLTGKIASVSPYIGGYTEGFDGSSSVADFETMLQLVYLYFTAPRKDDNSYQALINMYKASLANSATDPRKAFSDSVSTMVSNHNVRTVIMNIGAVDKMNQDKALAIFKDRFANPADFTFVFTGNVNSLDDHTRKAICTYLGGLKAKGKKEAFTDVQIRKPKGKVDNFFTKDMKVKKASNFILYSGNMPFNIQNKVAMTAIGSILNIRYLESIREKEGGSYGVGVRGTLNNTPIEEATLLMQFDTDPEKQAKLLAIIHAEIQEILTNGPRPDDLQKVKENMLKKYAEDIAENSWWDNTLVIFYQDKLDYVTDYKTAVEALSPELIKSVLKQLTDQSNVLQVVMSPAQ